MAKRTKTVSERVTVKLMVLCDLTKKVGPESRSQLQRMAFRGSNYQHIKLCGDVISAAYKLARIEHRKMEDVVQDSLRIQDGDTLITDNVGYAAQAHRLLSISSSALVIGVDASILKEIGIDRSQLDGNVKTNAYLAQIRDMVPCPIIPDQVYIVDASALYGFASGIIDYSYQTV